MPKQHLTAIIGADARKFNRTMGNVRKSVNRIGKAVAGVSIAAGAGLIKLTADAVNFGDAIDKAAKRTGLSAEAMQAFALAADLSGSSMEGLEKGVKRMASVILDAENGLSTAQDAFDGLGISLDDIKGKTPEQQLRTFLSALADVEDMSKRSALAQDVFGRAGTDLLPMLSDGAAGFDQLINRASELGIVLDGDAVAAAAKAKDRFTELSAVVKNIGFSAVLGDGEELATILDMMTQAVVKFRDEGGLQQFIENMKSVAEIGQFVFSVYSKISDILTGLVEKIDLAAQGTAKVIAGIGGAFGMELNDRQKSAIFGETGPATEKELALMQELVENTRALRKMDSPVQ
jgi:hypothetical protein